MAPLGEARGKELWVSNRCVGDEHIISLEAVTELGAMRVRELDRAHVELIAELSGDWPPILLWSDGNRIVDGYHRVAAARLLKMTCIQVEWFDGTAEQAYIESIKRNTKCGLPLTLRERVEAATNVLEQQSDWSDRRIAVLCGLSASTVARVRGETLASSNANRLGSDGRVRPSRPGDARRRVLNALEKNPNGSLRSIASLAAVSPETVRSIKRRLQAEGDKMSECETMTSVTVTPPDISEESIAALLDPVPRGDALSWESDVALVSCDSDEGLVKWLSNGSVVYDWPKLVTQVPLSRVYEIADESRRRAGAWTCFANALEARATARGAVAS
jgi:ParB-like chromosome segregation protein Spo0J